MKLHEPDIGGLTMQEVKERRAISAPDLLQIIVDTTKELERLAQIISSSAYPWMRDPKRGGFDLDRINATIRRAKDLTILVNEST